MPCHLGEEIESFSFTPARVVKLVDTPDLGSGAARRVGSSPPPGTIGGVISLLLMMGAFPGKEILLSEAGILAKVDLSELGELFFIPPR